MSAPQAEEGAEVTPSTKADHTPLTPAQAKTKLQEQRAHGLIELIQAEVGPEFNSQLLEIQAIKYLNLEEKVASQNKQTRLPIQHKTVVAACCYLQYKQGVQEDVREVFKVCKNLGVKPGKALDFLNKWSTHLDSVPTDEDYDVIRFSKEIKAKVPDTEEKLKQKKERAMARKRDWLAKNRESMNCRKRELYHERKALKQQQMYAKFKNALTQKSQHENVPASSLFNYEMDDSIDRPAPQNQDLLQGLQLVSHETQAAPTPARTFTPGIEQPAKQHSAGSADKPAQKDAGPPSEKPKLYNPFPCSHCDGVFLSWGGLFMHK